MWKHAQSGIACFALFATAVVPLAAQYGAHVVVTGGKHAGTYEMQRPSCTIDSRSQVSMVDTSAAGKPARLASLVLSPAKFALEFGSESSGAVTPAGFSTTAPSHLSGPGLLTLTYIYGDITFVADFAGATLEGADSVHVAVQIGCKGVKRIM
jgi:hypothetical protein